VSIVSCRQETFAVDINGLFKALSLSLLCLLEYRCITAKDLSSIANISSHHLRLDEHFYDPDHAQFGYQSNSFGSLPLVQYWDQLVPSTPVAKRMEACKNLSPACQ
jgi:hypothetical protein